MARTAPAYRIERADTTVPLRGDPTEPPWTTAAPLRIDQHPWSTSVEAVTGAPPIRATARLLYDTRALYAQFVVDDGHRLATVTERNGPVWTDSCVELFVSPCRAQQPHYANVEMNSLGTVRLGFGPDRERRDVAPDRLAASVEVETSVADSGAGAESDGDGWWLAAAVPFDALSALAGTDVAPTAGTVWSGNLQCCRGEPAPSYAVWSSIDAPEPEFHRPDEFGRLRFG